MGKGHWKHRSGRPHQTWLHTVESDVAPLSTGLATAYHQAQNQQEWRLLMEMATSVQLAT